MTLRGTTLVGAVALCLASVGCGARGSFNTIVNTDAGSPVTDTGSTPPTDTGATPPTDTGTTPPTDTGTTPPTDTGTTPPTDTGVVVPTCSAPNTMCGADCVDTRVSITHCGSCGHACGAASSCTNGTCTSTTTCPAPGSLCSGVCVNTSTDIANCGACGRACSAGQYCNAGTCTATSTCSAPRMTCGASCIDITTDVFNCGACNRPCNAGQTCSGSRCVGGTPTCPSPTLLCGTACVNVTDDPANCGSCGHACGAGTTCTASTCVTVAAVAAGGTCSGMMCGPGNALSCATGFTAGGFCSGVCNNGATASEQTQCGGAGTTCLSGVPLDPSVVGAGQGLCTNSCNPEATSATTGGCRPGLVCTGYWMTQSSGVPDNPGCFPFCTSDAQCAGVSSGGTPYTHCNTRLGYCMTAGANLTLSPDGSACNPDAITASGVTTCRGTCFTVDTDPTHGLCGSYINTAVTSACPDPTSAVAPRAPAGDNLAICVYRSCAHNTDCGSPLHCVYPESAGAVRSDLPPICSYATPSQPSGIL